MPNNLSLIRRIKTPTELGDLQMAEGTLVSVTGHIGKQPLTKQVGSKLVCTCSVAVSWGKNDDRKTVWVDVQAWEDFGMAELLADFSKGDAITVVGPRKSREYNDKTYWSLTAWEISIPVFKRRDSQHGGKFRQEVDNDSDMDSVPF
jgi:single-stranded DNA-binding protein